MNVWFGIFCLIYSTAGNREIVLCNNITITCENDTIIEIVNVQFGPISFVPNSDHGKTTPDRQSTKVKKFETLCNGKHHCYVNNDDVGFETYKEIPRLLKISYICDFEYIGCYQDNVLRLFSGRQTVMTRNMSALICRKFCKGMTYFGTTVTFLSLHNVNPDTKLAAYDALFLDNLKQNSDECFCGYDKEYVKLNGSIYQWAPTEVCNASCKMHRYEKCGRHGYISVYSTKTAKKYRLIKTTDDPPYIRCGYNASVNYEQMLEISRYCNESELGEIFGEHDYYCDEDNFCTSPSMSDTDVKFGKSLSKYVKLTYRCKEMSKIEETEKEVYETEKQSTGLISGIVGVTCLLLGFVLGFCFAKRKAISACNDDNQGQEEHYIDLQSQSTTQTYDGLMTSPDNVVAINDRLYNELQSSTEIHNYEDLSASN